MLIGVPRPEKRDGICDHVESHEQRITAEINNLAKLENRKSGLMNDLLTGRVRVPEGTAVTG
jgi:hypothetical protein